MPVVEQPGPPVRTGTQAQSSVREYDREPVMDVTGVIEMERLDITGALT